MPSTRAREVHHHEVAALGLAVDGLELGGALAQPVDLVVDRAVGHRRVALGDLEPLVVAERRPSGARRSRSRTSAARPPSAARPGPPPGRRPGRRARRRSPARYQPPSDSRTASSSTASRPTRLITIGGGALPARKPGTRMLRASAFAACVTRRSTSPGPTSASTRTRDSGSSVVVVLMSVAMRAAVNDTKRACASDSPPGSSPARSAISPPGSPTGRRSGPGGQRRARGQDSVKQRDPCRSGAMSRFANLPIAVRLGAAFGLLALALLAVTLLATRAFGTFHDDTQRLEQRDVRALAVAGQLGQDLQGIGRETADHLYVHDGDLKAQDEIGGRDRAARGRHARGRRGAVDAGGRDGRGSGRSRADRARDDLERSGRGRGAALATRPSPRPRIARARASSTRARSARRRTSWPRRPWRCRRARRRWLRPPSTSPASSRTSASKW